MGLGNIGSDKTSNNGTKLYINTSELPASSIHSRDEGKDHVQRPNMSANKKQHHHHHLRSQIPCLRSARIVKNSSVSPAQAYHKDSSHIAIRCQWYIKMPSLDALYAP